MSRMTLLTIMCRPLLLGWFAASAGAQTGLDPETSVVQSPSNAVTGSLSQTLDAALQPESLSATLEIMILLTVLSLAPAILVMTTSFTRIIVVLALLRQALGTQQLPPSQVITGLALFMTFAVMAPTWSLIYKDAVQPYVEPTEGKERISQSQAWENAKGHLRGFMINQITTTENMEDVYMFVSFSPPSNELQRDELQLKITEGTLVWEDVTMANLIPAFITSELKQAFLMGFYIYLPFLVIDLVIASILMSMGMMMLPPVLISLPFKLLLFVLVNGWHLVISSLLASFAPVTII